MNQLRWQKQYFTHFVRVRPPSLSLSLLLAQGRNLSRPRVARERASGRAVLLLSLLVPSVSHPNHEWRQCALFFGPTPFLSPMKVGIFNIWTHSNIILQKGCKIAVFNFFYSTISWISLAIQVHTSPCLRILSPSGKSLFNNKQPIMPPCPCRTNIL